MIRRWLMPKTRYHIYYRFDVHPVTFSRLTPDSRAALEAMLERLVYYRSKFVEADTSRPEVNSWTLRRSENIDALLRSSYLLATNALRSTKGDGFVLADGETLLAHQLAWRNHWKEYFVQRAREGISTEYASAAYSKYSLASYYNVRDFGGSSILRGLAEKFLTLYWADVAHDYHAQADVVRRVLQLLPRTLQKRAPPPL